MAEKFFAPSFLEFFLSTRSQKATKLDDINNMIDWTPVERRLKKSLKRAANAVGKPAYPGIVMFKCLVLQRMYNLSDLELEEQLRDRLSFLRFVGLGLSDDIPDSTTICRFRNELLGHKLAETLFADILLQLGRRGTFKCGVCVDATVIESSRRPQTTLEVIPTDRCEPDEPEVKVTHSDDAEAAWLKKGKKSMCGYKAHMASCADTGLVLGGHVTPANRSDMKELDRILDGLPDGVEGFCYADKGYASAENRKIVAQHGLKDAIMSKAARGRALTSWERLRNRMLSPLRSSIERIFGTFKRSRDFSRSRYVGMAKVEQEFFLVALSYNLVRARTLCFS